MGTEYQAYAGVGFKLKPEVLYGETKTVYSCTHEDRGTGKFCSHCGIKITQRQVTDESRWDEYLNILFGLSLPDRYEFVSNMHGDGTYYVGYFVTIDKYDTVQQFVPLEMLPTKQKLLDIFRPYFTADPDVLDESSFGFWGINRVF